MSAVGIQGVKRMGTRPVIKSNSYSSGAILTLRTEASKLTRSRFGRPVAVTHVSQATCPESCAWNGAGCYAQGGPEGVITLKLGGSPGSSVQPAMLGGGSGAAGIRATLREIELIMLAVEGARVEPANIRGVPLRLHVTGDVALGPVNDPGLYARLLGKACSRWVAAGGGPAWTYTHNWRSIGRRSWGESISVLASCETDADVRDATVMGYGVALVRSHAEVSAWGIGGDSLPYDGMEESAYSYRAVKCPQQTGQLTDCASCLACARDSRLLRDTWRGTGPSVIVLDPHGPGGKPSRAMRAKLETLAGAGGGSDG